MDIDDYQNQTSRTAIFPNEMPEDVPTGVVYCVMGMNGEAGECLEKVKKAIREDDVSYLEDLEYELGDVAWYWAQLIEQLNKNDIIEASSDDILEENLDKLLDRQERNKLGGEGDNR